MVTAMVSAVQEHGWAADTVPLFPSVVEAVAAEPVDPALRHFDHDDPIEFISPRRAM
jgi:hypothetical protein